MTLPLPEELLTENQESLAELAWALETSQGQFSLIIARCNYARLRDQLLQELQERCAVKIQVIELHQSAQTLYSTIREKLGTEQPEAMTVFGLESISNLDTMLTATNQVREEFRKNFAFPLVLWVNDEVLNKLMQLAPDFESWATTTEFKLPTTALVSLVQNTANSLFSEDLATKDWLDLEVTDQGIDPQLQQELRLVARDLQSQGQILSPEQVADLEFISGRSAYTLGDKESALAHFQKSLSFWRQHHNLERQGVLLFRIALCHADRYLYWRDRDNNWKPARENLEQCIEVFEQAQRPDLVAKFISWLCEALRHLKDWPNLETLAQKSLALHQSHKHPILIAQDYGFLAEVALNQSNWQKASQRAEQALQVLDAAKVAHIPRQAFYRLILAQAQRQSRQVKAAIQSLETAKEESDPNYDPKLQVRILEELHDLYYQEKEYLNAFLVKQRQRSVEQQYGFTAFIGAGRLQPLEQKDRTEQSFVAKAGTGGLQQVFDPQPRFADGTGKGIEAITASGRQQDVQQLRERIERPDYKLIVIHGQSGVGKSSLVGAGLVPALKQHLGTWDNLPVLMRVYTKWIEEFANLLAVALAEYRGVDRGEIPSLPIKLDADNTSEQTQFLIEQLHGTKEENLRPVLIFDQFEEFFFVYPESVQRRPFFEFLRDCLDLGPVKVILSLREDYLHFLLECNRLPSLAIMGNDILSKNVLSDILSKDVLYGIGNFRPAEARSIIQQLTQRSDFQLEPALIEELVTDLAGTIGEVRPIELQVVGAQLQTEQIRTLTEYRQRGPKKELVKRYLAQVVADCGEENYLAADLVLYLLTDEKGTRPLKTRAELERDLKALPADLAQEDSKLDVVLQIFVKSGLVFLLKENPADRYQLVHDYLAAVIRQEQEQKLKETQAALDKERQKNKRLVKWSLIGSSAAALIFAGVLLYGAHEVRKQTTRAEISETEQVIDSAKTSGKEIDALIAILEEGGKLNSANSSDSLDSESLMKIFGEVYNIKQRNILEGDSKHVYPVYNVYFSQDGKTLAIASSDNTVKLWNLKNYQIKTVKHGGKLVGVYFSLDGKTFATAGSDSKVTLWDFQGDPITTVKHDGRLFGVYFSPDGKKFAIAGRDGVKLWDFQGVPITNVKHGDEVYALEFSRDSKTFATAGSDGTVKLWNLQGQPLIKTVTQGDGVYKIRFSHDGKTFATAGFDETVQLWNLQGQPLIKPVYFGDKSTENKTEFVYFDPDGKKFAIAFRVGTVKLWDFQGHELKAVKHGDGLYGIRFSPDGKMFATTGFDGTVKFWDFQGHKLKTVEQGDKVSSMRFSPDGKMFATAGFDGTVRLWDLQGQEPKTFAGHKDVRSASFSPDGRTLATASYDKTVKLWDVGSGKELKTLRGHKDSVRSVSFSPDGRMLASASDDKTVKLWDISSGHEIKALHGHTDSVRSVSFSPDGRMLASASDDYTVKLWDVSSGHELQTFKHPAPVMSVNFIPPDGKTLVSADLDGTVKLWDLHGQQLQSFQLQSFKQHDSVNFSPDGKTLVSAGRNGTLKLLDLQGQPVQSFKQHDEVYSVNFSPDGKMLVSAGRDGKVKLWNFHIEFLLDKGCTWLRDYLTNHPESLVKLEKVCNKPELLSAAAPNLVEEGDKHAKKKDKEIAIDNYRKASEWKPGLVSDPEKRAKEFEKKGQAEQLIGIGEEFANAGQYEEAVAKFQEAKQLDPKLTLNPQAKARRLAAPALIQKGVSLAADKEKDQIKAAIAAFSKAQQLDPKVKVSAKDWNSLCWDGSVRGYTTKEHKEPMIMSACDRAVAFAPAADKNDYRDSRGIARALTGNTKGAIDDFKAFIAHTQNKDYKAQRQRWIKALQAGKNPFTPEELKKIFDQ